LFQLLQLGPQRAPSLPATFTFGRDAHATHGALQQPQAQAPFQRRQPFADRRRRQAQLLGRTSDRATANDTQKHFKVGDPVDSQRPSLPQRCETARLA
jgi:hypothetical protein